VTRLSTQQLARLSRLLDEVVDADEAARLRWLEALPDEHRDLEPALRRALLPRDPARPLPPLPKFVDAAEPALPDSRLRDGDRVGPYRLVRRLGAGGMAEVWLAQRADGAFQREVALKTPSRARWRTDLEQRFAVERDILAGLEHPNIAHFYDAGVGEDGAPYLALEYVAGRNLLQWADERRARIGERIELFLQVVQAVQYAHEHGVLHRDIKPNNVLVTATGQVKLLDFGVARLMQRSDESDLTKVFGRAFTPAYASPEQIHGEHLAAASDVYSLGVVLYELLSGRQPHERAEREKVPERRAAPPSSRLDAHAASLRGDSLRRVVRAVEGDLDAITLKALAAAPSDRYASADALARDLRLHLSGQPVQAVPDSLRYRAAKFVARHRGAVAAVTGVAAAAAVVIGIGLALLHGPGDSPAQVEPPAAVDAAPALPTDKSVAVLPFVDLSEQRDQEYLSDGLTEELIDRLARSPSLRVIARTSAFAFKGRNEDARAIAAQLQVAHLLTGSVRKSGEQLRISAQLVRAADGAQLWSQTYERRLADVFKVQDEIAGAVARSLEAVLLERAPGVPRSPDVAAYNLVLQGDVYTNGPFERDAQRAEVAYKKAIAIDPAYAQPWVRLAQLYMRQAYLSWLPKAEGYALASQAIDKALDIDPDSIAAQAVRFHYLVRVDFAWAQARATLDRMRTIDPRDALLLPECEATFAAITGNLTEAIKIQGEIAHRDPLNAAAIGTLAFYLLHADRFDESLALLRQELRMNPHAIGNHALAGVDMALLGGGQEALAEVASERHKGYRLWATAIVQRLQGRHDESDAALAELKRAPQSNAYYVAQLHAVRGQKTAALDWLTRACTERQSGCETLKIDRFLRDLRDEPRYRALLAKLKLGDN
jgi:serine/threonine protein kinase/TolB-like protein